MLNFLLKPFRYSEGIDKIRGSALQLALISSGILASGGYYISTTTDAGVKSSKSYMAANAQKSLGLELYSNARSNGSILASVTPAIKTCFENFDSCTAKAGKFSLKTASGKPITGQYNRYGHNCSDPAEKVGNNFCDRSDLILEVSEIKYEIEEQTSPNGNKTSKLFLSYGTKNLQSNKPVKENFLSDRFEFSGLGSEKKCSGNMEYVTSLSDGEAVCSKPIAYKGPRGDTGERGQNGRNGIDGPNGPKGPDGPRGPRGSHYFTRTGGCFAAGTQITLADGSFKLIENVQENDKLYNPVTGNTVTVSHVVAGPEELPMVTLVAGDKDIEVTLEHPMVKKDLVTGQREIIMAQDLKTGDLVQTVSGFEKLSKVKIEIKGDDYIVYNLNLSAGSQDVSNHLLQAEGFVTGDLYLQNMLIKKEQKLSEKEQTSH